ncbi:hypothetical protein SAMN04487895_10680 [Paenibacillus sophorae]|uniref:Uncharacterized protein n=1 Tax=Paenibacillus sophorae TaxID=1333845 RepID=A0A1H8N658_9BACL|nr:hypothetical protein [Paenibacillus sophorae]SEO25161.1 hypothetical protein SAMN04487895_10680 [Paenibacillus sophorae]
METKPLPSVAAQKNRYSYKTIIRRLNFCTKKLNKYSQQRYDYLLRRIDKQPPASRIMRLQLYKSLMYHQISRG